MPFENAHGNGGLLTTVGDLLRWNRNFTEMKVGGPAFVAAEQQLGHLNDDRAIGYAAGLFLLHHHGLPDVSHSGATAGYRGWLARYPGQGLAVAMLCNNGSADPGQLGHAVADVYLASVLSNDATMPSGTHVPAASAPVGKETLDSFAGLYRSVRDRTVISIEVRAGHLEIDGRALRFVSDNLFREGATGPLVRFDTDTGGNASRFKLVSEADPDNYYERVVRATPTSADLAAIVGEYKSDEAEVTPKVTLEPTGL